MKLSFRTAKTLAFAGLALWLSLVLAPTPAIGQQALQASTCEDLASLRLAQTRITSAALVPEGPFSGGGGRGGLGGRGAIPSLCRHTAACGWF